MITYKKVPPIASIHQAFCGKNFRSLPSWRAGQVSDLKRRKCCRLAHAITKSRFRLVLTKTAMVIFIKKNSFLNIAVFVGMIYAEGVSKNTRT